MLHFSKKSACISESGTCNEDTANGFLGTADSHTEMPKARQGIPLHGMFCGDGDKVSSWDLGRTSEGEKVIGSTLQGCCVQVGLD